MKAALSLATALAFALLPLSAHARIERVIEKTFVVQPDGLLTVETAGGNVTVQTAQDNQVRVTARQNIRASSEQEADEILKKLELTIEQSGNDVSAIAKYQRMGWGRQPVQVDFIVTVPGRFRADVKTSGGDVKIGDLAGKVRARTSGGNIRLGRIGADVDAHTSGGDVTLQESAGAVKLGTSGGNIRVERAVGPTDLNTSGGDIQVGSVENTVSAETSGGNVTATIRGAMKGDCHLSTSGGDVRVKVERTSAFNLDASTSGGDVSATGLTITIDSGGIGRSRLAGKVNGGGPLLRLRTSGGNVGVDTL